MNTLRHKIEKAFDCLYVEHSRAIGGNPEITEIKNVDEATETLQSIAEDFAVKFAEWMTENTTPFDVNVWEYKGELTNIKRLIAEFRDNFYSPNIKEGEKG